MSLQTWQETIANDPIGGSLNSNYTTAKNILNGSSIITLPANFLRVGRMLQITATGGISNIVTTPGLMNFQIVFGASSVVFDTGNIQLNATAHTTLPFWLDILLTCRSTGGTGTLIGQSIVTGIMFTRTAGQTDDAQGMQSILAPATAPATTTFDSTSAQSLQLWAGFTIANAGNGVQVQQFQVVSLN